MNLYLVCYLKPLKNWNLYRSVLISSFILSIFNVSGIGLDSPRIYRLNMKKYIRKNTMKEKIQTHLLITGLSQTSLIK